MSIVAELAVAVVAAFLDLLTGLLTLVFSSGFMARHSTGMRRVAYVLTAISALHLLVGLTLPLLTDFRETLLSPAFSGGIMLISALMLFVSISMSSAIGSLSAKNKDADSSGTSKKQDDPILLSYVLAAVIVFIGLSIWAAQSSRNSLIEEICDVVEGRIDQMWKDHGDAALSLAEKYLKPEHRERIPCVEDNR